MGSELLDRLDARSLVALTLVGAVSALLFLLAVKAPESDAFKVLLGGVMTTGFAGIIQWYFGSSAGSKMKDEVLAETAKRQADTIAQQSTALGAPKDGA